MNTTYARTGVLLLLALGLLLSPSRAAASAVNAGGDDVVVMADAGGFSTGNHLFMAGSDTLFNVFQADFGVVVMRSTDRGTTWSEWGGPARGVGERLYLHGAALTRGPVARLHVLYAVNYNSNPATDGTIRHAWTTYTGAADWHVSTPFSDPSVSYWDGDLAVDALEYGDYRVYAVAVCYTGGVTDLHYARSTDQGDTWEPVIELAAGASSSYRVHWPKLAWGSGRLHVAWSWGDNVGNGGTTNGVRYRYATGFAATLGNFAPMQDLLPADVGPENNPLDLVASSAGNDIYLLYSTVGFRSGGQLWRSLDGGTTWSAGNVTAFDPDDDMTQLTLGEDGERLYVSGVRTDQSSNLCQGQPVTVRGVASATTPNLLVNPGFEDPAAGGVEYFGGGDGWTTFGGGIYTVTDALGPPHGGAQSLKLFGSCCSGVYQQFPTAPGQSWTGSAWVYNNPADPLGGGQVAAVNIEWIQADGVTQSAIQPFVSNGSTTAATPQGVWIQQVVTGTAPADAAFARLTLITGDFAPGGPGGAPLYDDVSFVRDDPTLTFDAPMVFAEHNEDRGITDAAVAIDPAASDEFGVSWLTSSASCSLGAGWPVRFDATWRNGPGYPVTEPGYPVPLANAPAGPLTVAQLDGDPELEFVWMDSAGELHVTTHAGVPILGTPTPVGAPVDGGAVAVGDLSGDGVPALVIGDADGRVHAFSAATGALLPGFPVDLGAAPARVAVGAVAAPWPRSIVATCGAGVHVINYAGRVVESWTTSTNISQPPAIGDLDFDGQNEIVVTEPLRLTRLDPGNPDVTWSILTGFTGITTPPTLTDLHVDGTIEVSRQIVFGTAGGAVKAYMADGSLLWTFDSGDSHDVSAIASTFNRGTGAPGLQFVIDGSIYSLRPDGTLWSGFPFATGTGGRIAPVVGTVNRVSSDIVYGNVFGKTWCLDNFGREVDGWPRQFDDPILFSPVIADIDADGRNEVVVQTSEEMRAMDVNFERQTTPRQHWEQWGFDAGHTFCLSRTDSPVVSPVPDEAPRTRIAFAPPHPNPSSGANTFQFTLPDAAEVSLKVYDVRGRLVNEVAAGRYGAGRHVLTFDGRGRDGRTVADGIYFARLSVQDGTGRHEETRKLVILR